MLSDKNGNELQIDKELRDAPSGVKNGILRAARLTFSPTN